MKLVFASIALFTANLSAEVDFNRDIRPILAENCFYCHGQDAAKRKAELRLDQPGDYSKNDLLERIFSHDLDEQMPPPDSNRKLSETDKNLVKQWIDGGSSYKVHWAFVPPVRPQIPGTKKSDWAKNPIDHFVLAKLEEKGLSTSSEADRPTLIKRLYADLVGLAPSPEEVATFVNDPSPKAYEALVDKLLTSPHYGERLALPWLDAARYADSNGFQQDGDTWQWMWRDWVVKALNDDLPFDQFTIWQLAGDLLPGATVEQKIASGFNRNHLSNGEGGNIAEEQRFVVLFDRLDTTATTWLGLTMACAQCHDHKYDPITQRDYYQFLDAFNQVNESGVPSRQSAKNRVSPPFIELPTEENKKHIAEWDQKIAEQKKVTQAILDQKAKNPELKKLENLQKQLADYKGDHLPRPMVMDDAKKRDTHILDRGAYLSPLEKVTFATPSFLPPQKKEEPRNRLGLAKWLVDPNHPLTSRVQVNRMWHYFFGVGLVKTSEDFGVQSEYPIHMNLLDWLAAEYINCGWSAKKMHRLIVTSAAYRQDSRMNDWHRNHDPANRLLSRGSRFRIPSMVLRDWALSSSGLLNPKIGGVPVYPYQPNNPWETLAQVTKERDFTYPASRGENLYRRSIYTFWRRTVTPANMFDASSRQACRVSESRSNTPLHALTMLNDPTWVEAARVLAELVMTHGGDLNQKLSLAFQRVNGRSLSSQELALLKSTYQNQLAIYLNDPDASRALIAVGARPPQAALPAADYAAMTATCLAIYNFDESLTRL
jgi:Protein of unknown function (DUF1549)/Protein of unknown function (DUF1553)/Planctomycete cytochrome C